MKRRTRTIAGVGALLAVGVLAVLTTYEPLEPGDRLEPLVADGSALLPEFGPRGALILRYDHGADTGYAFSIRNRAPLPVTVTGVELPTATGDQLLRATEVRLVPKGGAAVDPVRTRPLEPFRLAPGEERVVVILGRFDACEFYTERAIEVHDAQPLRYRLLGLPGSQEVAYPHDVMVRSPTIQDCPERVLDRAANRRTDPTPRSGG